MERGIKQQPYIPAHLAIQAMRDNGYKNTTYAIAELIDNSIQAEATLVEVLCAEREQQLGGRRRKRIEQIAVLDNGTGMNSEVLYKALQFGNGTRLESGRRSGIGKFGVGLPNSSISQCKRVEVWTWQNGVENAIYTYLDVNEIKNQERETVPEPEAKPVPEVWRKVGKAFENSGTLVVWSNLDRLMWRTANAVIDNSEFLIGRLYRRFLNNGNVKIRLVSFDIENPDNNVSEKYALPNDPGYLMDRTSCPAPFHDKPMFKPYGEPHEVIYTVDFQGEKHDIKITFSYAKEEARAEDQSGSKPYGRHAQKNVGISIVRSERELELDQTLVLKYDTRERWWGVEIEFPPSLDELFGVTNNKQYARNFSDVATMDIESLLTSGKTLNEVMQEMTEEGDPRAPLIQIAHKIKSQLTVMRNLIKAQGTGARRNRRHREDFTVERTATSRTRERQNQGYIGNSDADEQLPSEQRQEEITQILRDSGVAERDAGELAARTVSNNLKYVFAEADLETDAFFSVKPRGGAIIITLNTRHPAYDKLIEVLEDDLEGVEASELGERLAKASDGLKLLLMAWARYEDELPDGFRKQNAQDARNDWGRIARNFLMSDD